jgi:hypothetical protein
LMHEQVSSVCSGSPATHTSIPELRGTFPEEVILKLLYEREKRKALATLSTGIE